MSTLNVTYTFSAGEVIKASEHNQNLTDIVTWANGNIGSDNLDTMSGTVTWSVTTNDLSISSTNTGTEGSATFAHNGALATGKSGVKFTSNSAQTNGTALVEISSSSSSSNIPALKVTDAGGGSAPLAFQVVSTTKASLPAPVMTTAQKNALTTPATGSQVFDSTLGIPTYYNSGWKQFLSETAVDNSTIEFSSNVLRLKDDGVTGDKLNTNVADGSTLELASDQLRIKDDGVTTAKILNSNVTSAKIQNNPVFPGTTFGSAGSAVVIEGSGSGYRLGSSATKTLAQCYGGTSGRGYRILSGKSTGGGGSPSFSDGGEGLSVVRNSAGNYTVSLTVSAADDVIPMVIGQGAVGAATIVSSTTSAVNFTFAGDADWYIIIIARIAS